MLDENKKDQDSYEPPGVLSHPLSETPITGLNSFIRRTFNRVNEDSVSKTVGANGKPLLVNGEFSANNPDIRYSAAKQRVAVGLRT